MNSATQKYTSSLPQETLLAILGDPKKYAHLHPLILSATEVEPFSNRFKIIERPFKLLPFRISYFAQRTSSSNAIHYGISGIPFSVGEMWYTFDNIGERETRINWHLGLSSKLPIETWLANKMINAQNVLITNLNSIEKQVVTNTG